MKVRLQCCVVCCMMLVFSVLSDSESGDGGNDAYFLQVNHREVEQNGISNGMTYTNPPGPRISLGEKLCNDFCVLGTWLLALGSLIWLVFGILTLLDWYRQKRYLKHLHEIQQLHPPVPCSARKVPPSGQWLPGGGATSSLSFEFKPDGTFTGESSGRNGSFLIRDGRFNIEEGTFMWEEVIVDPASTMWRCCKLLAFALVFGPCTLCQPLSWLRQRNSFAAAPRKICVANGTFENDRWKLQGRFISYDKARKGCVKKLKKGNASSLDSEEMECESPIQKRRNSNSSASTAASRSEPSRQEREQRMKELLASVEDPANTSAMDKSSQEDNVII
eukprot:TRINITY_DN31630_c0_g1_i1.p1 TRINITY_DN31630_c0_g1~~TRINITY_DN31630_c0_g1_i1.p1  ORF type:complete len:333 (-),score=26.45 TRINITY_DN31630_c0_g1_i1:161-1159(-)